MNSRLILQMQQYEEEIMDDFRPTSVFNNSTQIKLAFNIFWTSNSFTEVIGDINVTVYCCFSWMVAGWSLTQSLQEISNF